MEKKINDCSWLASLSLFGELYNKSIDIYEIIGMFLTQIIRSENKYRFKLNEITQQFNDIYHFGILDAVIHPALKRLPFIEKTEGYYLVDRSKLPQDDNITKKQEDAFTTNDGIIESLVRYIEQKKGIQITENEKTKIIHSFCAFLLDEKIVHENYVEFISAFIVQTQEDETFKTAINRIREGVILYTGLKYDHNLNELGTWNTALTIFLDTEIIFHYAGYNGEVYKKFFNDFYGLVKEINGKSQKKLISLKYFTDTKNEIESFFDKARFIVEGKDKPNPSVTAMMSIIDGCHSASDVLNKKTDLFYNLKTVGILEDDHSGYYNEENRIYNMFDQKMVDYISNDIGKDPSVYIKFLNFISILRKNNQSNNFANIGFIFLTGNSNTLKIAWNDKIKENGNVPLATHLSWLTNKFWFKMNKGLGNKSFPSTIDAITKAQMLLSSIINNSISGKYDEMQVKYKNGSITEEQAISRIVNLRNNVRKPEDIVKEDVDAVLDVIKEEAIDVFLQEQEHFKLKAAKQEKENTVLKQLILEKEMSNQEIKNEVFIVKNNSLSSKKDLLVEKENMINDLNKQKLPLDQMVIHRMTLYKFILCIAITGYYAITFYLIYKFGWNKMESWTYIINTAIPIVFLSLYFILHEKTFAPINIYNSVKNRLQFKTYSKFGFDSNKLNNILNDIRKLKVEIQQEEQALNVHV